MNNKLCTEMAEEILASDGDFSPSVQQHTENCAACAALADSWNSLRQVELPSPREISPTIDFAVLRTARKLQQVSSWMLPKWFYAVSSAACAIMFSWLVVYSHQYEANRHADIRESDNIAQMITMFDSGIEFNRFFSKIPTESEVDESVLDDINDISINNELPEVILSEEDIQLYL